MGTAERLHLDNTITRFWPNNSGTPRHGPHCAYAEGGSGKNGQHASTSALRFQ